jgi:hypothetical protein
MIHITAVFMLAQPYATQIIFAIQHRIILPIKLALPSQTRLAIVFDALLACCFARITFGSQVVAFGNDLPTETTPDALRERIHTLSLLIGYLQTRNSTS